MKPHWNGWSLPTLLLTLGASPLPLLWKRVVLSSHSCLVGRPASGQPYEAMVGKPFAVESGREGRGKERGEILRIGPWHFRPPSFSSHL